MSVYVVGQSPSCLEEPSICEKTLTAAKVIHGLVISVPQRGGEEKPRCPRCDARNIIPNHAASHTISDVAKLWAKKAHTAVSRASEEQHLAIWKHSSMHCQNLGIKSQLLPLAALCRFLIQRQHL